MTGVADKWFAGLASDIGLYLAENDGGGPSGHGTQISSIGDKTVNAVVLNTKFNSVAYAGTEIETSVGGLWRSTNADASAGSISFTNVFNTTEVKKILIDPRFTSANDSSKYLFWVTTSDVIYYSTDRGSSWSTVTGNLPGSTVINDIYGDPVDTNAIYLATSNGLFKAQLAPKTGNLSPTSVSFVPYCVNTNFSWNAMTGATAYRIQISTSPTFAATLKDTTTSNNSYVWTGNKTCGTTYYWRVASTNGFGQSPWANQSFTASAQYPNQTAPANGATNLSNCGVTLSWSTTGCATGYYEILLAEDANFTIDLQRFDNYGSTSLALDADELDCNTTYYWKVRVDSAGQWSNTRTFSTVPCTPAAPTNIFPPNSQTLIPYCGTFNFAVSGVNAYQYTIQIASDTGFSNVVITSSDYDSVVTVTMSSLSASTTYYWRAIIYDICNSAYSAYSSRWSFTTSANFPDVPYLTTLSSPTDGYDSISVALPTTFTWSTLKYELYHRLQIDNNNDFSSPIVDTTIYFNIVNAAIQPQYSCFATYYWRVRASNCDGDGNWSSTFSFTTRCPEKIGALIENNAIPVNYSLLQNYPNPFNPVTQIQYELPEDQHVILKVYDMLGREVATLVNEYQAAGYRFAEFNAATLPSGIYIYRIQAGKFSDMKKMLLVK
ncbi:MAG: T9SS type A sorting domain-containing protein [Bacteroidetes bacterium]|nr:MAG: T9SS type A sorting domain-containing protein [Bacteroidota bacterium]